MGIELELAVLLFIQLVGSTFFARFEIVTPAVKKIIKWALLDGVTIGLYFIVRHYAIVFHCL